MKTIVAFKQKLQEEATHERVNFWHVPPHERAIVAFEPPGQLKLFLILNKNE